RSAEASKTKASRTKRSTSPIAARPSPSCSSSRAASASFRFSSTRKAFTSRRAAVPRSDLSQGHKRPFAQKNFLGGTRACVYSDGMRTVRLYLRLGDRCYHTSREEWGLGSVVEEMTSTVEGGT